MTRNPPQNSGRGMSGPSPKISESSATRCSNSARSFSGRDWSDAIALIRLCAARVAKYSSAASSETGSTMPRTRTWRRWLFQWNPSAAFGVVANCCPFALSRFVKKTNPASVTSFSNTTRTSGMPSAPMVASDMAFESFNSLSRASAIQVLNSANGSATFGISGFPFGSVA